jgi:pyruvate/2-oxoglutarate dehydrogenase complex dihydrolipoamide acyltransferase (E2) component
MATNGSYQAREKVSFATMQSPALLTLESDGEEQPGRAGLQYRYFLGGGKIAWVDPPIHDAIQQSGAHAGDTIKVARHETRNGNRRGPLMWSVHLHTQQQDEPPAAAQEATRMRQPPPMYAEAAPARPAARQSASPAPAPQPAAPAQATAEQSPLSSRSTAMAAALVAAVDAARTAESYSEAHGTRIVFSSDDIRAMAATIYIGAPGGAR